MNIRTITYFAAPGFPLEAAAMRDAGRVTAAARAALQDSGHLVQTVRLALPAIAPIAGDDPSRVVALARALEAGCLEAGIDYATIGVIRPGTAEALLDAIPDALAVTERVFASSLVADVAEGIDVAALRRTADVIDRLSRVTSDGFGNLRFAALFNVPAGVPFLPAAYHDGGPPMVAVGVEAAGLAVEALAGAASWAEARARLIARIEEQGACVLEILRGSAGGCRVGGIDFSLAPYPEEARSIGTAIERLSGSRVGRLSTLAAVACLAGALDAARIERTGYMGVFLPVFEDAVLAARAAQGQIRLNDLLLYSSVCGTGLDTVPLPGDVGTDTLAAILLDVAALAVRLDKPLSARLMPIPDKRAGDEVAFDFPFFAPTRVMAVENPEGPGLLATAATLDLRPRGARA